MAEEKELILITGASGRIGFKCAERFASKYNIVGLDVLLIAHLPGVEFYILDIASPESIKEGLDYIRKNYGNKIASVIHLAAYYNFSGGGWHNYEKITINGTRNLLRGLQSFEVEQFIFTSTMLIHKPTEVGKPINENSPIEPKWEYPKSKVITEQVIHDERGKIPTVMMRIAGVYFYLCNSIPLANQLQRIYENKMESHLFAGNLQHGASFIHIEDLVEVIWLAVEKRKELPQESVFEIGEPYTASYEELQKTMGQLLWNKDWKTYSVPKFLAKIGAWVLDHLPFHADSFIKPWMIDIADDHYELDISHARQVLGWEPKRKVLDMIPKWVEEIRRDPVTFYDKNKLHAPHKGFPKLP
jgi:nucleoside-diphosphate-sugar epimerase